MSNRRTGKIARLPKEQRDQVNAMLRDNVPSRTIIDWLAKHAELHVNDQNITSWSQGGYQDWLKERERLEDMAAKREFALEIVRQNEGSKLHEATLHLAATQIYEALTDFDLSHLKTLLADKPENFANVVNSLAKLSKGALDLEKYRNAVSEAQAKVAQLREKGTQLNEQERGAILDEVDRILGLKK